MDKIPSELLKLGEEIEHHAQTMLPNIATEEWPNDLLKSIFNPT